MGGRNDDGSTYQAAVSPRGVRTILGRVYDRGWRDESTRARCTLRLTNVVVGHHRDQYRGTRSASFARSSSSSTGLDPKPLLWRPSQCTSGGTARTGYGHQSTGRSDAGVRDEASGGENSPSDAGAECARVGGS